MLVNDCFCIFLDKFQYAFGICCLNIEHWVESGVRCVQINVNFNSVPLPFGECAEAVRLLELVQEDKPPPEGSDKGTETTFLMSE